MSLNSSIFLVIVIVNATLLGVILFKQRKNLRDPTYLSFVLSICFLLLWSTCNYLADTTSNYAKALWYTRATIPTGLLTLWFICMFSFFFPIPVRRSRKILLTYLAITLFFGILSMTSSVITSVSISSGLGIESVQNTWLFFPIFVLFVLIPGHAFINLYQKFRQLGGVQKEQIRYTLIGWGSFLTIAITVNGILPLVTGNASFSKLGPLGSITMVGLTTYAILKHHFLDIRIVLQRGLIYICLLSITCSIYIAGLELIGILLHTYADIASIISAGITMILGVLFIRPLGDYFRRATDHLFFKDSYDYASALHSLSKVLHTHVKKTDIIAASSEFLKTIFKATNVTFYLEDNYYSLSSSMKTIAVPIIFEEQRIGTLVIGPKRSGDKYMQRDIQLIETFAYQAAVALEKGRLYETVEKYNVDLENLVEKRTGEIKKLQEDQKQIMIDISHNLQTPLAVIWGELELLSEFEDQKKIEVVKKSIDRVSGFIRQLLHLAKLEHPAYTIELSPIDLGVLLRVQAEYFSVMAEEKNAEFHLSVEPDIIVAGHSRFLEELLTNLVSNAILYRSQDRLCIISMTLTKSETTALITVEDNGIGIAAEDLPELFTRFYRAKRKAAIGQAGTGLGLAICKNIVERHNGTIVANSIIGEKTIFSITLPLLF